MIHGIGIPTSRAPAWLVVPAAPAVRSTNLLRNPAFERTEALDGAFRRPSDWQASAFGPHAGAVMAACPAPLTGRRAGRGAGVAWLGDGLPSCAPHRPTALYQTLRLGRGTYRFGGRFALRIWDAALDPATRRVLNSSQVFLNAYRGSVAHDAGARAPAHVDGTLLASIDLSPRRFAFGAFRRPPRGATMVRFAYLGFDTHDDVFALDEPGPCDVTVQLAVQPVAPPAGEGGPLVPLTHVAVLTDHLFVEPAAC